MIFGVPEELSSSSHCTSGQLRHRQRDLSRVAHDLGGRGGKWIQVSHSWIQKHWTPPFSWDAYRLGVGGGFLQLWASHILAPNNPRLWRDQIPLRSRALRCSKARVGCLMDYSPFGAESKVKPELLWTPFHFELLGLLGLNTRPNSRGSGMEPQAGRSHEAVQSRFTWHYMLQYLPPPCHHVYVLPSSNYN